MDHSKRVSRSIHTLFYFLPLMYPCGTAQIFLSSSSATTLSRWIAQNDKHVLPASRLVHFSGVLSRASINAHCVDLRNDAQCHSRASSPCSASLQVVAYEKRKSMRTRDLFADSLFWGVQSTSLELLQCAVTGVAGFTDISWQCRWPETRISQ